MAELISAVAQLMWPLIALTGILVFRRAIGRVLRTAERRELEFEIGGQRLTMHELNDQQNEMIQDLQRQLSLVSTQLEHRDRRGTEPDAPEPVGAVPAPVTPAESGFAQAELTEARTFPVQAPVGADPFAVLWVAERPVNNALLIQQLRENGVRVTSASTTAEALAEVQDRPYRLIISDMSRYEGGRTRQDAGLALVQELRDLGVDTPLIVFNSQHGQLQYGAQARQAGAVATTTSASEMIKHFHNFGLL